MNKLITALFVASFSINSMAADVEFDKAPDTKALREQAEANRRTETSIRYFQQALNFVPFVTGIVAAKVLEKREHRAAALASGFLGAIFSQHMIAASLNGPIMKGINYWSKWVTSFIPGSEGLNHKEPLDDILTDIEAMNIEYDKVKTALTKDAQIFFERLQNGVRQARQHESLMSGLMDSGSNNNEGLKKTLQRAASLMRNVLDLPRDVRPLPPMSQLKTNLEPLLSRYAQDIQDDIKRLTIAIDRSTKLGGASKSVIYLYGEPGTGKTTFVRIYAKDLDAHIIEIRNLEEALKADNGGVFNFGDQVSDSFKLCPLTQKLTGSGGKYKVPKNSILFLDEIDKFLKKKKGSDSEDFGMGYVEAFLLQLLDPNLTTITLPDLGIEIDVSGLVIVLAGNKRLPPALRNRMAEFVFPCIEKEKRPDIAKNKYDSLISSRPDLETTAQDLEMINQIAAQDPYCGVRSLEFVVEDYVNHKDTVKADWNLTSSFDIAAHFKKHPATNDEDDKNKTATSTPQN